MPINHQITNPSADGHQKTSTESLWSLFGALVFLWQNILFPGLKALKLTYDNLLLKIRIGLVIFILIGVFIILYCTICYGQIVNPDSIEVENSFTSLHFYKTGSNKAETFEAVKGVHRFDVVNEGGTYIMIKFIKNVGLQFLPEIVRLSPGERRKVTLNAKKGLKTSQFSYAVSLSEKPFVTHSNLYSAYKDSETVRCVPVKQKYFDALKLRTKTILQNSKTAVSGAGLDSNRFIYTPGPVYRRAGLFARDFLYQLEGSGSYSVSADEVRFAVDFLAKTQLKENRKVGAFTYPKGAIPDHVYPDGRFCWGPGEFYGDNSAHFRRPSMDEAMCFVTLAWHYGYKAGWDDRWKRWFKEKSQNFTDAWNSIPRNPKTGLVTQWSTPDHIGANGITENNGACVMWGFHDSYGFGGDDLGTSVLACNAARAMTDMFSQSDDSSLARRWAKIAADMRDAIRVKFNSEGYLPWGSGPDAPEMASPDITGYAVWSNILSEDQANAASDWFAKQYLADKAKGGAADLFQMAAPFRGAVRMARKSDDYSPGRHVWPDMTGGNHWENLAYGYNAYQDGGYWYYMSLGVATTLWKNHPELAIEWVGDAYSDLFGADLHHPYERIDGTKPENDQYNASAGSLLGMGMPATFVKVMARVMK